jgi:hypothetical protein
VRGGVEKHCSCHERPLPLLYQGEHEVWYEEDCVYRGGWLDGNWHGRGVWVVKNKYYVGQWVCGLFTAIISFENAGDEEKDQVRGQVFPSPPSHLNCLPRSFLAQTPSPLPPLSHFL